MQSPQYTLNPKNPNNHAPGGVSVAKAIRKLGETFSGERLEPLTVPGPSGHPPVLVRINSGSTSSGKILPPTHPGHPANVARDQSQAAYKGPRGQPPMQKMAEFEDPAEPVGKPIVQPAPAVFRANEADVQKIAHAIEAKPVYPVVKPEESATTSLPTNPGAGSEYPEAPASIQAPLEELATQAIAEEPVAGPTSTQTTSSKSKRR